MKLLDAWNSYLLYGVHAALQWLVLAAFDRNGPNVIGAIL